MDISLRFELFRVQTEDIFHALSEYQSRMEIQLNSVHDDEYKRFDNWATELEVPEEGLDKESILKWKIDDFRWTYEFMFPRSLRYSFIVLLFLVLESQLNGFCKELKEQRYLKLQIKDINGDVIERFKKYLNDIAGLPEIENQIWESVQDLAKVRNCIVHTLGRINDSKDRARLDTLINQKIGLSKNDNSTFDDDIDILLVSPEYCTNAVKSVSDLFDALFHVAGVNKSGIYGGHRPFELF